MQIYVTAFWKSFQGYKSYIERNQHQPQIIKSSLVITFYYGKGGKQNIQTSSANKKQYKSLNGISRIWRKLKNIRTTPGILTNRTFTLLCSKVSKRPAWSGVTHLHTTQTSPIWYLVKKCTRRSFWKKLIESEKNIKMLE